MPNRRTRECRKLDTTIDLSSLTPEEQINVMVYEQRNLGVVNISTRSVRPDTFLTLAAVEGSGSGSVIDAQGTF